jgi:ribonuclease VapC
VIAVDSSALIAILRSEPERVIFSHAIAKARQPMMSAVSLLETSMVLAGPAGAEEAWHPLDALISRARMAVIPFDEEQAALARAAFRTYGKGRHPAALNFGDCAAYALAKSRNLPLLFKGGDFSKTDIPAAL